MRAWTVSIGLFACCFGAPDASALPCGTVLTRSVTLTTDVVCGPGQTGLMVAANNVRIDLNGFSVIGPFPGTVSFATGISASRVDGVTILGPGRVEGFYMPIEIEGGVAHTIRHVTTVALFGMPATLRNASLSIVEENELQAVAVVADPGFLSRENLIAGNHIGAPAGGGVWLRGCGVQRNVVYANKIASQGATAVLLEGARGNRVQGNRIQDGPIFLLGAVSNRISNNTVTDAAQGIWLRDDIYSCVGPSRDNRIVANEVSGGSVSVSVEGTSHRNRIGDNVLSAPGIWALFFESGTHDNDARGNRYIAVPTIAQDFGTGNLWP